MRRKISLYDSSAHWVPGICYSSNEMDQGGGGGDSGGDAGGNDGDAGGDNAGQEQLISADFWNAVTEQAGGGGGDSGNQGGNAGGDTQAGGGGDDSIQAFQDNIRKMDFGFQMTPEMQTEVREGNFENFGNMMNTMVSNSVIQGAVIAMKMLKGNNKALETKFNTSINKAVGSNDARKAMHEKFPSSKDPRLAPIAEGIWAQALKRSGGNNEKAGELAEMFSTMMVDSMSKDLGIEKNAPPPGSPGSEGFVDGTLPANWVNDVFALMKPQK